MPVTTRRPEPKKYVGTAESLQERKRRLWSLIQQHDPGMAALIEALSKTPGPWSDALGGKSIARLAVNGEWSDGHDETAEDERRRKHMDKYLKARRLDYDSTEYARDVRRMRK